MMIDNSFPVQLAGDNNAIGFLQQYVKGKQDYSQQSTDPRIPTYGIQEGYAQELGGPLISRTIRYSPPNAILKAPHIDSPFMDQLFERDLKPLMPPKLSAPKGPQLPSFL